jgi:hypothetical protein
MMVQLAAPAVLRVRLVLLEQGMILIEYSSVLNNASIEAFINENANLQKEEYGFVIFRAHTKNVDIDIYTSRTSPP